MIDDDAARLAEVGRDLPAIDLDDARSRRIAQRARGRIGRGPSPRRLVEPIAVAVLATSFLVWALLEVLAAYR